MSIELDFSQKRTWNIVMIAAAVIVAISRIVFDKYIESLPTPLGLMGIPFVCFPLVIITFIFISVSLTLIVQSIIHTKNLQPSLIFVLAIILAFLMPLPPHPPTPEKTHFIAHRSDYEAVVQLVRSHQLVSIDNTPKVCLPSQYENLSVGGCIYVYRDTSDLQINFNPIDPYYHPLIYTDHPYDMTTLICGADGSIEEQIDDHWYVCVEDWN